MTGHITLASVVPAGPRIVRLVGASLLLVGNSGCLGDMFVPTKRLAGDYRLVRFEGERYYIEDDSRRSRSEENGVLNGTVEQIGWNDQYVLAWREGMSNRYPSGWMIIDVRRHELTGPLSEEELKGRIQGSQALIPIKTYPVSQAWKMLGGS